MDQLDLTQNPEAFDNFWYQARRELIAVLCRKYGIAGKKILEVGCGAGSQLAVLSAGNNQVAGSDINYEALHTAKSRGLNVFYQDIETDIASSEEYDVVCAFDVLEHLKNDGQAIRNIYRLLKPGGLFVFSVPAYQSLFSNHDKYMRHQRRYGSRELKNKLTADGFKPVAWYYWNSILFPLMALKRIISKNAEPKSDISALPKTVNRILYGILIFENRLIGRGISFCYGLSIVGIVKK